MKGINEVSKLSERVKKAKKLTWSYSPHNPSHYGTWGSDKNNGKRYYNVDLSHSRTAISTPDGKKSMTILETSCRVDTGNGKLASCPDCQFNNAICKHSLGALYESFRKSNKLISFFETYEMALQRKFSGKIVKIMSLQGKGFAWAVVKEWPKKVNILPAKENIQLMRGSENDEGID